MNNKIAMFTTTGKGGVGKSVFIALCVCSLVEAGHKKDLVIIDADDQSKTTENLHSKELKVHTDKGFSEDEKKQHRGADPIIELWEKGPGTIFITDTSAGDAPLVAKYYRSTAQEAAELLGVTTIAVVPILPTKGCLEEAADFIERNHKLFHIIIAKNLYSSENDPERFNAVYTEPSVRKIGSKLEKLIDGNGVYQLYLPEIPQDTYSKILNKGISFHSALHSKSELRFAERIRLRNLVQRYSDQFLPLFNHIHHADSREQEKSTKPSPPPKASSKKGHSPS